MVELNSFICGDCMEYLPQFPDKYFDLLISDPPYGIGEDGSKNKTRGARPDFGGGAEVKLNITQKITMHILAAI